MFTYQFNTQKKHPTTMVVLSSIMQDMKEDLQEYIDRFTKVVVVVVGAEVGLKCLVFKKRLREDSMF